MLEDLKNKFHGPKTTQDEKIQLLTTLPILYWNISKAAAKIGTTRYFIRKAKKLLLKKGILATAARKVGMYSIFL